jgi:hypothetical protein
LYIEEKTSMRVCKVCSLPKRARNAIDKALVSGTTFEKIHKKFGTRHAVTKSAIWRHSRHALKLTPEGTRPRPEVVSPNPDADWTLVQRVENLIAESRMTLAEAREGSQLISATAALREIRANIELLAKLSGELSTASINFNVLELTETRVEDLLEAVNRRGPDFVRDFRGRVMSRFGNPVPALVVNFVKPGGAKLLEGGQHREGLDFDTTFSGPSRSRLVTDSTQRCSR